MPGTLLLDDWRSSVEDQLHQAADQAIATARAAQQATIAPVQQAAQVLPQVQAPDPNQVGAALHGYVDQLGQQAQQAAPAVIQLGQDAQQAGAQVLGGAQQAATAALGGAQDAQSQVGDALHQHVNNLLSIGGGAPPVTAINQPPTLGGPQGAAPSNQPVVTTLGGSSQPTAGDVSGGPPSADTATSGTPVVGVPSWLTDLIRKNAPPELAGDPDFIRTVAAGAKAESGWDPNAVQKGGGGRGLFQFDLGGMGKPYANNESVLLGQEGAQLQASQIVPLYAKAYQNAPANLTGAEKASWVAAQAERPYDYQNPQASARRNYASAYAEIGGPPTVATTPPVTTAQARAADLGYRDISQFGDSQLTSDEAYASCGPAAAVNFAEKFGRNPTLREATDLAKQVGWTSGGGMAGISSEQKLMSNLGIDTKIVGRDWAAYAQEAQTGNPVTISTPGHYYFADGYNPESGAFHVGRSGLDLKGGSEWMTPSQMENLMGQAQGALFANNPTVPNRGNTTSSNAAAPDAINAPAAPAAKAPIVMGGMQDANGQPTARGYSGPTLIQTAQDAAGEALGGVGQAVGGAASALGTAAQGAVQGAQQGAVQVAPILGGAASAAGSTVRSVADDLGQAAQGAVNQVQELNRQTPGTTVVNAAAPVLGGAASDLGTSARNVADTAGQAVPPVLGGAASDLGTATRGAANTAGQTLGGTAGQIRQQVQDTIDSLPSNATVAQARQVLGTTLDTLGPRALEIAGDLPLPMGGTVSDLQAPVHGAQAGLQTIEDQRQQQIGEPADMAGQFQQNVDAARRGDWGAFARGTLDLTQKGVGQTPLGGAQADLSQSVSAALTAGGIDPNAARVLGQVANVIGPIALERAIPSVVSASARGANAAVNAGLEAIDRLAPPEIAVATTRRAGESADDYLARLANEASAQRSTAGAGQLVGPGGEPLRTTPAVVAEPPASVVPETAGFRAPGEPVEGLPGVTRTAVRGAEPAPVAAELPAGRAPITGRVTDTGTPQRVSPQGEILSPTTGQPVETAGGELAGNIRLPKFVQQPVADIIAEVHAADPARFEAARRGVVTDQMVRDLADEAGTTVNRVAAAWKPGKTANAETTLALRTALADRALRVRSAQNLLKLNPSSIDARNTLVEALNQHAALQEVVSGVTGEAGRTLRQFRQPITGEQASLSALQRIAKNTHMSPEELSNHLANVDLSDPQAVASLAKTLTGHSFADKAQALWYFNLLSSPVTWTKNLISNGLVAASRPVESLAAAGIDLARAGITGTERQRFMGEAPAEVFGMTHSLGDALRGAYRVMRTGVTPRELENPELAGRTEPFQGRLADLTVNVPGRVLSATDALFRTLNEQGSVYKLAYRQAAQEGTPFANMADRINEIVRNPTKQLLDQAKAEGEYRIFQNKNAVGQAAMQVREAMPFGTGRFVLPFINTPVNVGAYALERSPLAVAKLAGSAAERSGGQLSDNIARMTLGSALAGFAATQGYQGNITGAAPDDPTERDAWQREGKQPYSVRAPNGVWYSYAALQPFSSLLAAGAAAGDAWKKGQNDPTTGLNPASLIAITGVAAGRAMIDQPWLQGLSGLVDMLTSSSGGPGQPTDPMKQISVNAQRALASGVVPAGVRLLARAFDPTSRTSDPGFEGFGQQLAASIPGLTQNAPPRLGAFGQPIQRPGGSGVSVLNPFNPSPETDDPVEKELRRLQNGGYDVEPSLAGKRVTLIGEAIGLTPDQQRQYQTLSGVMTHDLLSSLLATDAYRNLRSDQQALVINRLSDRVADAARKTLYPSLLDQAVNQKIAETARRQQTQPPDWLIRQATGSAEAPTGEAPTGSANRTVEVAA